MKDFVVEFLLGAFIKTIDEIADVPSYTNSFVSYIKPLSLATVFLYGLHASNDFYYNLVWFAWFISAYFGKSMDNEVDKYYWNISFLFVLFALWFSFSFPFPETHIPTLLVYTVFTGVGNILDNMAMPEEVSLQKLLLSVFGFIATPIVYFYVLSPLLLEYPSSDLRFATKHLSLFAGYFFIRTVSKAYLYFSNKDIPSL